MTEIRQIKLRNNTTTIDHKVIEVVMLVNERAGALWNNQNPSVKKFDYVSLLQEKTEGGKYDLFVCWMKKYPKEKYIFLGHWNDGVVL